MVSRLTGQSEPPSIFTLGTRALSQRPFRIRNLGHTHLFTLRSLFWVGLFWLFHVLEKFQEEEMKN